MRRRPCFRRSLRLHRAGGDGVAGIGDAVLISYIVGGLLLFGTSFLPSTSTGWRIFNVIAGLGIAGWAAYVELFGGTIITNFYIAALPFILAIRGIIAMVKSRRNNDEVPVQAVAEPQPPYAA